MNKRLRRACFPELIGISHFVKVGKTLAECTHTHKNMKKGKGGKARKAARSEKFVHGRLSEIARERERKSKKERGEKNK